MNTAEQKTPALYVVATPIGNLGDLSPRAAKVIETADILASEDTRVTAKLLKHLSIKRKSLESYHNYNESEKAVKIIERMLSEKISAALVSDAGTPCISDPGFRLVSLAHERGIPVIPVPGPSALTALVSASGLPSDRLLFAGFLPAKSKALREEVESWKTARASVVFYESPRRLSNTLEMILKCYPVARLAVGRELTKLFEEIKQMNISEAVEWATNHQHLKGEVVIMATLNIQSPDPECVKQDVIARATELIKKQKDLSQKSLLSYFSDCGIPKKELYKILNDIRNS